MVDFQERDTRRGIGDQADRIGGGESDGIGEGHGHDEDHGDGHADEDHGDAGHDHHADDGRGHHTHDVEILGVAIVTVSSTRAADADPSGDAIAEAVEADGHGVAARELVPDSYDRIQAVVRELVGSDAVDVVVTTGGTGVTPDDVTVEAVEPLFEKALPGFGELFRRRSEADIGTRVVATRATAGVVGGVPVFCLPGSEAAVRLGVGDIVLPEAGHLAGLARRHG